MSQATDIHLQSFAVVAIIAQQGFWWVIYKARGQRCGVLSEGGVVPHPTWWLPPLLALADEEVRLKDRHLDALLGPLK